ncbi:MAG: GNAT family N-acetyltransferase [Acidobacteriota bacterium]|nr:GNAT family N-acetyltransferase [Acidobacteriota bacterium]
MIPEGVTPRGTASQPASQLVYGDDARDRAGVTEATMADTSTSTAASRTTVDPLPDEQRDEALAFLSERPVHTVIMAGLLREYGPRVPAPPGTFYGCRDSRGRLEGLALIGRATMFEARTSRACVAFARLARASESVRMIMGEEGELREFWSNYSPSGRAPRLSCRELFYQFTRGADAEGGAGLRRATLDELEQIVSAHAEMVAEESGVNPLAADPHGFRLRCALRVAQGKVWTLIEKGELIFKAEVIAETPHAAYVEGVWVAPSRRKAGYGRRCWSQLSRALLDRRPAFCGFVNAANTGAHSFYERVGGTVLGTYDKVYV